MKRTMIAASMLVLMGCFAPLTQEEKDDLLGAKATFEQALETLKSIEADYDRLKREGVRLQERVDNKELSLADYGKAKAELEVFMAAVETKWRGARDDVESAANRLSEVQKQIKSRSGSGLGAWLQAVLGGFGLEIPAAAYAVLELIRRKRRDRQVGLLSRAGAKTRGPDQTDFGEALLAEMTPADRNALRTVEAEAAAGKL